MPDNPGFDTPWKGGFHITFENGCTVSVQFGTGSYSDNHDKLLDAMKASRGEEFYAGPSGTAEIAAFHGDKDWITLPHWDDTVRGYQTPAQVLEFMNYVANLPH